MSKCVRGVSALVGRSAEGRGPMAPHNPMSGYALRAKSTYEALRRLPL